MADANSKKRIVINLVAHQPYTRCLEERIPGIWSETLFPVITATYIPLLMMMERLKKDGVPFKLSLVLSPTLCALLDDPRVQEEYLLWLERLIGLGERELERTKGTPRLFSLAKQYIGRLKQKKDFFMDTCSGLLLPKFAEFARCGYVELLATAATFCFLPHYRSLSEVVDSQIEAGLLSHRAYFDSLPAGFWLPLMGYAEGLEKNIRKYGLLYTVLDSHGFLFSDPLPQGGIFAPARCSNGLAVFGRDPETPADILSTFAVNPLYRDQNRDIGFELPAPDLDAFLAGGKARRLTAFKYWTQNNEDTVYDFSAAAKQAAADAASFLDAKAKRLNAASAELDGRDVCSVCTLDARELGFNWYEGIDWLEQVFRQAAVRCDIECAAFREMLQPGVSLQKIRPFMSAAEGSGYGETLLDKSNGWMLKYAFKAAERMVDLAGRFSSDSGLKERCLNLAAKQLLVAQSSDWPRLLNAGINADYAEKIFKSSILGFSTVYDSLGSNCISTEWLTRTEKHFPLFPWINYRIFGKKI
ncbi:1,4-alpha-glucan branching protein domain-containing protein [Treponema sp. HNW]|uniref:1,4-alpha-glucan branching protein domain-containing protein n=1 Tax=Treponema sp. HNW TaxID=3116654 RepID=UPI003D0ED653